MLTKGIKLNTITFVLSLLLQGQSQSAHRLTEDELNETELLMGDVVMSASKHYYTHKDFEDSNNYHSGDESGGEFGDFDEEEDYSHSDYGKHHKYGGSDHLNKGKEYEKESSGKDDFYDEMGSTEGDKHSTKHQEAHGKKESDWGGSNMFDEGNKVSGFRKVVHKEESDEKIEFHDDSDAGQYDKYHKEFADHSKEVKEDHEKGEKVKKDESERKHESDNDKTGHGENKKHGAQVHQKEVDEKSIEHESSKKNGHENIDEKERDWSSRVSEKAKIPEPKEETSKVSVKTAEKPDIKETSKVEVKAAKTPEAKEASKESIKTAATLNAKEASNVSTKKAKTPKASKVSIKTDEKPEGSKKSFKVSVKTTRKPKTASKLVTKPKISKPKAKPKTNMDSPSNDTVKPASKIPQSKRRNKVKRYKKPELKSKVPRTNIQKEKNETKRLIHTKSENPSQTKPSKPSTTSNNSLIKKSKQPSKLESSKPEIKSGDVEKLKTNARRKIVKIFWPKNVQDIILSEVAPKKAGEELSKADQSVQHDTVVTKLDDMFGFSEGFGDFVKKLETFG